MSANVTVTAGRLLVASPAMEDPTFAGTVVLVLEHDADGTLGVVLNRPSQVPVDDVLPTWGVLVPGPAVLFAGGPVTPESALCVGVPVPGGDRRGIAGVTDRIAVVDLDADPESLAPLLRGCRVFAGYAGWTGGQLEAEWREGSWYVVDGLPIDVLTEDPETLWRRVLARQPLPLSLLARMPDDERAN